MIHYKTEKESWYRCELCGFEGDFSTLKTSAADKARCPVCDSSMGTKQDPGPLFLIGTIYFETYLWKELKHNSNENT